MRGDNTPRGHQKRWQRARIDARRFCGCPAGVCHPCPAPQVCSRRHGRRLRASMCTWKVRRPGALIQARQAFMPRRGWWSRKPSSGRTRAAHASTTWAAESSRAVVTRHQGSRYPDPAMTKTCTGITDPLTDHRSRWCMAGTCGAGHTPRAVPELMYGIHCVCPWRAGVSRSDVPYIRVETALNRSTEDWHSEVLL